MIDRVRDQMIRSKRPELLFLLAEAQKYKETLQRYKDENRTTQFIKQYKSDTMFNVKQKFNDICADEKELCIKKLFEFEKVYKKEKNRDSAKRLADLQEYQLEIDIMTKDELREKMNSIMADKSGVFEVGYLSALQRAVKNEADLKAHFETLRKHIKANQLDKPWTKIGIGAEVDSQLKLHTMRADDDSFLIDYQGEDGRNTPIGLTITEVMEEK